MNTLWGIMQVFRPDQEYINLCIREERVCELGLGAIHTKQATFQAAMERLGKSVDLLLEMCGVSQDEWLNNLGALYEVQRNRVVYGKELREWARGRTPAELVHDATVEDMLTERKPEGMSRLG